MGLLWGKLHSVVRLWEVREVIAMGGYVHACTHALTHTRTHAHKPALVHLLRQNFLYP